MDGTNDDTKDTLEFDEMILKLCERQQARSANHSAMLQFLKDLSEKQASAIEALQRDMAEMRVACFPDQKSRTSN
jgi:hypothetical protein